MGQRFVACDREQPFLIPPDVREWLPARHLAWFVIDAVAEMDLDACYAAYRVDGRSRPAYDPAMMVALLLYAYARGIRSSRVIERACDEDVAFSGAGGAAAARSRDDRAVRRAPRARDCRFVRRGPDAYLCRGSRQARDGVVRGRRPAGSAARGRGGGAGCGARGRPGLARSATSPCGGPVT